MFFATLLGALVAGSSAGGSPCPPAAVVAGASADDVGRILEQRGVAAPREGCPAVTASIHATAAGLTVNIVDVAGRSVERSASTAEAAATVVESWARDDVALSLFTPPATTAASATVNAPRVLALRETPTLNTARDVVAPAPVTPWIRLDVGADTGVALDGSVWPGAAAGACFQFGAVCAGAFAHAAVDSSLVGASADQETGRVALDGLLSVDGAFDLGGVTIRPGGFVGAGWMQSRNSPVWAPVAANNVEVDGGGMRGGARVVVGVPIGESFAVNVSVGADLALLAHTATYVEDTEVIAGEPLAFVRFGVGFGARR